MRPPKGHPRILLGICIPLVVLAALLMDNVAHVRNDKRALRDASRDPQTWVSVFCAPA
jgi:NNP family nitrate/nitrite transporter-like MFS transporter